MAATWPRAPRQPENEPSCLGSRELPWLRETDASVAELLLTFNNGVTARLEPALAEEACDPEQQLPRATLSSFTSFPCASCAGESGAGQENADGEDHAAGSTALAKQGISAKTDAKAMKMDASRRIISSRSLQRFSSANVGSPPLAAAAKAKTMNLRTSKPLLGSPGQAHKVGSPLTTARMRREGRARQNGSDQSTLRLDRLGTPEHAREVRRVLEQAVGEVMSARTEASGCTLPPKLPACDDAARRDASQRPGMEAKEDDRLHNMVDTLKDPLGQEEEEEAVHLSTQRLDTQHFSATPQPAGASRARSSSGDNRLGRSRQSQTLDLSSRGSESDSETEPRSSLNGRVAAGALRAEVTETSSPSSLRSRLKKNGQRPKEACVLQPETHLQGHMLFSSPLCLERPVVVRLLCRQVMSPSDAWDEVMAWKIDFEASNPAVVRTVRPGGKLARWNSEQEHAEGLLRPGDELLWLCIGQDRQMMKGQTIASCLEALCTRAERAHPEASAGGQRGQHVELVFRALRALPPLQLENEINLVRQSGCQITVGAATASNVRALIAAAECRILHLSLHCSGAHEQLMFLEDGFGRAHVVRAEDIKGLLSNGQTEQQIGLVFINACHSVALGVHFVNAGVKHVVCVKDSKEVRDESCLLFARDFYSALRAGRTVKEAFACGQAVLACGQAQHFRSDADSFVLLPENCDHGETFTGPGGAPFAPPPSPLPSGSWGTFLPPVEDFLGREVELHKLLQLVSTRRFVEVEGEAGIGKSTMLKQTGRFLLLRRDSFDEVHWLEAGSVDDDSLRQEYISGLERLRLLLASGTSRLRVLLLVDDANALVWSPLQALLRFSGVHMVITTGLKTNGQGAVDSNVRKHTIDSFALAVMANGLKPVHFTLGPLEPLAQAKLFLRRASRPLKNSDLEGPTGFPSSTDVVLEPPQRPLDFLVMAESPLLLSLAGNPGRLVKAAARLHLSSPEVRSLPPCASGTEESAPPAGSELAARRRVRLLRPDGCTRDEWMLRTDSLSHVLDTRCPASLEGKADIFVERCRAPREALLGDFPEDETAGMLVLEFREAAEEGIW